MDAVRQWYELFSLHQLELPDYQTLLGQLLHKEDDTATASITTDDADSSQQARSQPYSLKDLALRYFPVILIIILFWPVILTLIITVVSASSWVFWLFTSVCVGIMQLLYVTYQFLMIFLDLVMLSTLKTFATLRSQIRYYTIKSGLSKERTGGRSRRGRRREWRNKLDKANSYDDYLEVEIEEPELSQYKESGTGAGRSTTKRKAWHVSLRGLGKTRNGNDSGSRPPIGPPGTTHKKKRPAAKIIRKSQSCVDLETTTAHINGCISRTKSTENFIRSQSSISNNGEHQDERAIEKELNMAGGMLTTTTARLREARFQASSPRSPSSSPKRREASNGEGKEGDEDECDGDGDGVSSLKFLLTGVVKRNHLSVDDLLIEDAQSVAECGQHRLSVGARALILGYNEEVERCLDWIAESPVRLGDVSSPNKNRLTTVNGDWVGKIEMDEAPSFMHRQGTELSDRLMLLRKLKQNMGRSALMLSGGGAQAMYHLGTVRALVESKVYQDIKVISGTSGGSISAAMCALKTPEELHRDVCVTTVSTDYMLDGTMKRENIRWFPKLVDMGTYWLKNKLLVDSADFKRCCDFYYGDFTFEEAFERTGKHVCITVSASRAGAGGGAQRLLLNHISTPHVTLASAVAASCALPGVMAPAKLVMKNNSGKQEPFEVDGVEWIDGSVQADLPFKRISTLFNISNFVVCQTNFHVVPFLRKAHHPGEHSLYWRAFQTCEWDIRSRVLNLSRLGLFPRVFGHDISKIFKQKYHGNLTLVPRFTTMQLFGLKALVNPTVKDMEVYLKNGQIAAWPYLTAIKEMLRLECKIEKCISRLEERLDDLVPDRDFLHASDDVESISSCMSISNRLHFLSSRREAELMKQKVHTLEKENMQLKQQVEQLQRAIGIIHSQSRDDKDDLAVTGSISFNLSEDDEVQEERSDTVRGKK